MVKIKPFAALRPRPEFAEAVCAPPYDVLSSDEAREMAAGNPLSFLRVSKPEIDLPRETDPYAPEVYAKGRENFDRLVGEGVLFHDLQPCFYLYRQVMGQHRQVGLVAVASIEDYLGGVIKKHELTRPEKEGDRVRHMESLNSQTGPVFITYRAVSVLDEIVKKKTAELPEIDFTAKDGIRHTSWTIREERILERIQSEFQKIPALYIADGHHRSAAAACVFRTRKGAGGSGYFLVVIFPHDQVRILPYNRVLKDLNGHSPKALIERLRAVFDFKAESIPEPVKPHHLSLYLSGQWHGLEFRESFTEVRDPMERLDVTILQERVLKPIFGIADQRTSDRINFVGGRRGTGELEKLVNGGQYACAFSLFPTGVEDLMAIADAGGIMPPKSTWFEPKLRDGMFCHML